MNKDNIDRKKQSSSVQDTSKVTRVEIIDHSPGGIGRAYVKWDAKSVELSFQDDNRTLKIFIK